MIARGLPFLFLRGAFITREDVWLLRLCQLRTTVLQPSMAVEMVAEARTEVWAVNRVERLQTLKSISTDWASVSGKNLFSFTQSLEEKSPCKSEHCHLPMGTAQACGSARRWPGMNLVTPGKKHSRDPSLKTKQVYALLYTFNNNENNKQKSRTQEWQK